MPYIVRFIGEIWEIIQEAMRTSKRGHVFSKWDGTLYIWINKAWKSVREAIGRPDLRIHDFKGTVLTRLGNRGYDAFTLKEVSGNVEIGTLGRYLRSRDRDVREPSTASPQEKSPNSFHNT